MRTLVVGDIHGAYRALKQCLQRSGFDYGRDRLIVLGDASDGWPEVNEVFEELLKIKHMDYLLGNHDLWAIEWSVSGHAEDVWLAQGGRHTLLSYGESGMPDAHVQVLIGAPRYLEIGKKVFVHASLNPDAAMPDQNPDTLVWGRDIITRAMNKHVVDPSYCYGPFEEIYIGHTPTLMFGGDKPIRFCNVWAMDTGAGWTGRLTFLDIDSKEYWQSDCVTDLYPNMRARG